MMLCWVFFYYNLMLNKPFYVKQIIFKTYKIKE